MTSSDEDAQIAIDRAAEFLAESRHYLEANPA